MAEVVIQMLMEKLKSVMQREEELDLAPGMKKDMDKLSITLSTIRDIVVKAKTRQLIMDKAIADWHKMVEHEAFDALDELAIRFEQPEGTEHADRSSTSGEIYSMFSCFNSKTRSFRPEIGDMGKKFKDIAVKFDEITAQKYKFSWDESEFVSYGDHIYGREGDKENIIDTLLMNHAKEDVTVCPIVGMGGLGKTTLAQLVYNDIRVVNNFQMRIWVSQTDPFDVEGILKEIIRSSYYGRAGDFHSLQAIQRRAREVLWGKRYLLVLDDVWNENPDEWNTLKCFLTRGAKGSSIILTTRSHIVASITGTIPKFCLKALSDDDCWSLIHFGLFENNPKLLKIGKEIAEKCKGLPLAAISLGRLLRTRAEEKYWKLVRDREIWFSEQNSENGIISSLSLSYSRLRPLLRQCFALCSIFPKGHQLKKHELIGLWIENDIILSDQGMEPEDAGEQIFNELLERSFFQDSWENPITDTVTCKMHDLMHDLASSVMDGECLTIDVEKNTRVAKDIRHLSLFCKSQPTSTRLNSLFKSHPLLHSLLFFPKISFEHPTMLNFSSLTCLRVLILSGMGIETLPPSVCHLTHLKYLSLDSNHMISLPESIQNLRNLKELDLSKNHSLTTLPISIGNLPSLSYLNLSDCRLVSYLPESICGLTSLQALILCGCSSLGALPEALGDMRFLRHLNIKGCHELTKMPIGIGQLACLETLKFFAVGRLDWDCGGIEDLQALNKLNGELEIRGLENVKHPEDAREANLRNKQYLAELKLSWGCTSSGQESNTESVMEGLQLPPNIQKLVINEYPGVSFLPQRFLENVNRLRSLQIYNCNELVCLPEGLQKLTSLEDLQIECCKSIKSLPAMGIEGLNSCLLSLRIESCENLTSVSEGVRYVTSLQTLSVQHCQQLDFAIEDFQDLTSLRYLQIGWLPMVKALPKGLQCLTMLQHLEIEFCWNLRTLPAGLQYLKCLERLKIHYCPELELTNENFQHLISLRTLEVGFLPKLRALPEEMKHFNMLQCLKIWRCENLTKLAEGMKHLTALESLVINNCHKDLHRRCMKEGEDWYLISHISHLDIDKPPQH